MLKDLLNRLEEAEFFNKKCYQEGRLVLNMHIMIFLYLITRLTTIQCSLEAFKGLYGIIPRSEGYELAVNNRRSYLITILSNLTTKEKVKWIFRKTSKFVNIITSSRGIVDSETEAYIFGYLVSQQLLDFIYIDDLLLEVEKKKEISGKLSKGDVSYVMSTSGIYYDKTDKDIIRIGPPPVNGMVYSRAGKKKFIMMIPKSRKVTKSELLSTWSHELYHIARDSFGVMNREYFYLEDILVEYMEKSLPILKELIWKRRNM